MTKPELIKRLKEISKELSMENYMRESEYADAIDEAVLMLQDHIVWIPIDVRRPTKEDASVKNRVNVKHKSGETSHVDWKVFEISRTAFMYWYMFESDDPIIAWSRIEGPTS